MANNTIMAIENEMVQVRARVFNRIKWFPILKMIGVILDIVMIFLIIYCAFMGINDFSRLVIELNEERYVTSPYIILLWIFFAIWFFKLLFFMHIQLLLKYEIKSRLMGYRAIWLKIEEKDKDITEKIILVNHFRDYEAYLLLWDLFSANIFRIDMENRMIDECDFTAQLIDCAPFIPDEMNFPTISMHVREDPAYPHLFHCKSIDREIISEDQIEALDIQPQVRSQSPDSERHEVDSDPDRTQFIHHNKRHIPGSVINDDFNKI